MDYLWSPWRSSYIGTKRDPTACIFCKAAAERDDEANLIVHRATFAFVILNRYPYTSGHLMIAPYEHVARLSQTSSDAATEIIHLARRAERALERAYTPDGLNMGFNLGEAAGAGIEQHLHMHVLPRWKGDANFMTTVAETRVLPESLSQTYNKLKTGFQEA